MNKIKTGTTLLFTVCLIGSTRTVDGAGTYLKIDYPPPDAPFNVKASGKGEQGMEITWDAEADYESGIREFIVARDGKELATIPEKPAGKSGRPLFQSMTYHDTPSQPMPEMRYVDAAAKPGEKHRYSVVTVNSVGLKSEPSTSVPAAP